MSKGYVMQKDDLIYLSRKIFESEGVGETDACTVAESLVEADLRGTRSHGVARIENYIKRLRAGGTVANVTYEVVKETPSTVLIDAHNSFGSTVSQHAVDMVRKKAMEQNIAFGVVRQSNHFGAGSYWALKLAGEDMIGFSGSNVEMNMVAIGSRKPVIGNNPFAIAFPAEKHTNVCVDMATSTVAFGKILEYRQLNKRLPDGWFVDADGEYTNDPFSDGIVAPFAAHKGFGIAVAIEAMTSLLSEGAFGDKIGSMYNKLDEPNALSHYFGAIRISAFRDPTGFRRDVDDFIENIKRAPRKNGVDELYYPGELEERSRIKSEKNGIVLTESLADELIQLAKEAKIEDNLIAAVKANPVDL